MTLLSPHDIIQSGLCIGCGSCVADQPDVQMRLDRYGHYQPAGDAAWLRQPSAAFTRTCPFSPDALNEDQIAALRFPNTAHTDPQIGCFETAYVGYVAAEDFRVQGSSGGMVTWVATELLRQGLVDGVAHVVAADPQVTGHFFRYQLSRSEAEIRQGAKSRYYPIELSEVLHLIRATPGRYAVVGVPCFIKALHLLRLEDALIRERVAYTLGLFCGHMKSARLVESFAWQLGVKIEEVARVEYRLKDPSRPASWYTAHLTLHDGRTLQKDWWHLVDGDWGAGFFQNSACNFCDDVVAETADIAFGDAWVEPYSSDGRGTNVVIVRSPAVQQLVDAAIADGRLHLEPVDSAFIVQTQAAGFRQRREGLAYRLTWPRAGVQPRKRVEPDHRTPTLRRKMIYRIRSLITAWSHRMFWLAQQTHIPALYTRWARLAVGVYHGLAYSRGRLGKLVDRVLYWQE